MGHIFLLCSGFPPAAIRFRRRHCVFAPPPVFMAIRRGFPAKMSRSGFDKRTGRKYIEKMPNGFGCVDENRIDQSSDLCDKTCNLCQPFKIPETERAWDDCARIPGTVRLARSASSLSGGLASAFRAAESGTCFFFALFPLVRARPAVGSISKSPGRDVSGGRGEK